MGEGGDAGLGGAVVGLAGVAVEARRRRGVDDAGVDRRRPAFDRSRQWAAAWRVGQKWPLRWTLTTASHSASDIEKIIRSRRMPALLTRTSSRPNASIACCDHRARPASKSVTSAPLTIASPPMASISATTSLAGPGSAPVPSGRAAEVVHDDLRPLRRQHQGVLPPDAPARPGHDRHPSLADPHVTSPSFRPTFLTVVSR